jgi:hypothetical protein
MCLLFQPTFRLALICQLVQVISLTVFYLNSMGKTSIHHVPVSKEEVLLSLLPLLTRINIWLDSPSYISAEMFYFLKFHLLFWNVDER